MKKIVLIAAVFVVALAAAVSIMLCSRNSGSARNAGNITLKEGVLSVGVEIGYPPFEYFDTDGTTPIGFDVSMAKAIGQKLGLKVEFIDTAWDGIFAGVDTDRYDCVISAVTITPERLQVHNFSKPYIGNAQSLVLLKNTTVTARTPEDLNGYSVAYQAETMSDIYMTELASKGLQFEPFEYDKVLNCFDDLRLGRVDAIVCDSMVAVDYINKPDSVFEIVWQGTNDETFGICMKKGNNALTEAVDKALDELFAEGTMQRISQEIFNMDMVSSVRK